nr:FAD-binding and (Fe-S)-binding domain-containing protein [Azospirillum sp. SYSU D00513]
MAELRAGGFRGDLSVASGDRVVLATDNSIYQVTPEALVFPREVEDIALVARTLAEPRFAGVVVRPRGGGTGTNGQSLGEGVVVDVSRHMNRILEINAAEGWVRVQAGVVKDQLNAALLPHGMFFAPELSTSNRATIGGMISTDASGQGSCLYGKTRDHVLELTAVLMDGAVFTSRPVDDAELAALQARADRVGEVHRVVDRVQRENAALIEERFPKLNRCLTGYDLAHIRGADGRFNLNSVLCGSEGTLGFIAEAKLRILPIPRVSTLVNLRYASFDAALRDAGNLVAFKAASIETVDSKVLGLARGDIVWHKVKDYFPDEPGETVLGINLVEFVGDDPDSVAAAVARLTGFLDGEGRAKGRLGYTLAHGGAVDSIWEMRKKSVGLLGKVQGRKRPIPFVEDTAVPPESLADYIAEFRAALDRRGLEYGMFGHVDAGVLHVRPALDLKDPAQEPMIREITEEVVALTMRYGGLLWGEHGKGMRSEFVPRFFGPLYPCLADIKRAFDPRDQINPGKIASAKGEDLLRVDNVPLRGQLDRVIPEPVRERYDEALHCNGNGACYNYDADDAMCPSWKATRERRHSPKGRSALVREWLRLLSEAGVDAGAESDRLRERPAWAGLAGRLRNTLAARRGDGDFSHVVKEAMDGCLACKSCTGQCPIKVDVPSFRAKFLELYHGRYLRRPRDHIVGALEDMLPHVRRVSGLYNAVIGSGLGRQAMWWLGLADTPRLSPVDLDSALRARGVATATPEALAGLDADARARSVVLVQDAFTSSFEAPLVVALVELIQSLGFTPWLAPFRANGKALHVHGFLGRFRRVAERNAAALRALAASGVPLVGVDPSITLTYRSEYPQALGAEDSPRVLLIQEWLAANLNRIPARAGGTGGAGGEVTLLPHCTERTNATASLADWSRVFAHFGVTLRIAQTGCCGMAGTYGHEVEHLDTSRRIYDSSWRLRLDSAMPGEVMMATGYSCRSQVARFGDVRLEHPVQILLRQLRAGGAVVEERRAAE